MVYNNNYMNNYMYLNISDSYNIRPSQDEIIREESDYVFDLVSGFFYNLKNVTQSELKNFILFYGGDIVWLSDKYYLKMLSFFISLFYNEAILLLFIKHILLDELYMLLSNKLMTKIFLVNIMKGFNDRLVLEMYRYFLSYRVFYPTMKFIAFKNFIISRAFFFDSEKLHYHYFFFMKQYLVGFEKLYFYENYSLILDKFYMDRLSILNIIEYFIDNLIYNLHNYLLIIKNTLYTYEFNFVKFKFLKTCQYPNFIQLDKVNRFTLYLNSLIFDLYLLHEIISFFRFYLYNFYQLLMIKNISYILVYKYYKYFRVNSFMFVKYIKTVNSSKIIFWYYIYIYNIIRSFLLKFLKKKNVSKILFKEYIVFYNSLNFIFVKIYNNFRINFLYNKNYINPFKLEFFFNKYFLKKKTSVLSYINYLFDLNISIFSKFQTNILKKILVSSKFAFNFKLIFFIKILSFRHQLILENYKCNFFFLLKISTNRIFINYFGISSSKMLFFNLCTFKNLTDLIFEKIFLSINYVLHKNLVLIYYQNKKLLFLPFYFKLKQNIEEFFFY